MTSMPAFRVDYVLGLDLGKSQDYSALAVLERTWKPDGDVQGGEPRAERSRFHYSIRYLKRWLLGTSYTNLVLELGNLVRRAPLANSMLAVDQTGVGAAVVDMLRQARVQAHLHPILITAGHAITRDNGIWHVPKKELVGILQVLLQCRRLRVAPLPERELLVRELLAFRVKISQTGNETFESLRERDHDDLVLAVALAAWLGERSASFGVPVCVSVPRRTLNDRMAEPSAAQRRGLYGLGRDGR